MRRAFPLVVCALGLGLPATAHANAGIGFFLVAVPFVAMAMVPAMLVEAPILSRLLDVSFVRGFWWSVSANFASAILGSLIAVAVDVALVATTGSSGLEINRTTVLVTLVPMFWLTWLLERSTIRHLQPAGATRSAGRATLVANAVSYALLAAAVAFVPSAMLDAPSSRTRYQITEAVADMSAARAEVAEYHAAHKRFPAAGSLVSSGRHLRSLRRDAEGRVIGIIEYPGVEAIHGKTVVIAPGMEGNVIMEWICYTPDAPHKFLPAGCRRGPPEGSRQGGM
jgi:hypothetical protein